MAFSHLQKKTTTIQLYTTETLHYTHLAFLIFVDSCWRLLAVGPGTGCMEVSLSLSSTTSPDAAGNCCILEDNGSETQSRS